MAIYVPDHSIVEYMSHLVGMYWDDAEALAKNAADNFNIDFEENKEELTSLASYAIRENY